MQGQSGQSFQERFCCRSSAINLNRIRCSVGMGRLILGMIFVSRLGVDADVVTVNPYSEFCRSFPYDNGDTVFTSFLRRT